MKKKLAAVVLALLIVFIVYCLVSSQRRVPPMPRVSITEVEERQVAKALGERARLFKPTPDEEALIALFHAKNRAEAKAGADGKALPEAEKSIAAFREAATAFARKDQARYLLIGDFLAVAFDRLLEKALAGARATGLEAALAADARLAEALEESAGTFLTRAVRQGMIGENGQLYAPRMLPIVLYRVVWRHLGGVGITVGFERAEEKAYYDYVVAMFRKKSSEADRRKAISRLKSLDGAYDHVLAEAIVLYESGKPREARAAMQSAIDAGRSDAAARQFVEALGR